MRTDWLARRWLAKCYSPPSSQRKTKWLLSVSRYIVTNKVTLWAASYSACVVYTKTIIHLSVGEKGGYLSPPCPPRWIIVNYSQFSITFISKKWRSVSRTVIFWFGKLLYKSFQFSGFPNFIRVIFENYFLRPFLKWFYYNYYCKWFFAVNNIL